MRTSDKIMQRIYRIERIKKGELLPMRIFVLKILIQPMDIFRWMIYKSYIYLDATVILVTEKLKIHLYTLDYINSIQLYKERKK